MIDLRMLIITGATAAMVNGAFAAENLSTTVKDAPATQPGLPDPSSTARMSDVGDGTGNTAAPTASPSPSVPQATNPGASESPPNAAAVGSENGKITR